MNTKTMTSTGGGMRMNVKVLIVDDEPIICRGLRETVPWDEAGVTVVGEAYDGEEALRLVAELDVDLVLTDICMPEMDGLRLAETLKETMPDVRIAILSGYGEFEYARQAVRLGIEDFLLKPADIPELLAMVSRMAEDIRRERRQAADRCREKRLAWLHELLLGCTDASLPEPAGFGEGRTRGCRFVASAMAHGADFVERAEEVPDAESMERWRRRVDESLGGVPGVEPLSVYVHTNVLVTFCRETEPTPDDRYEAALAAAADAGSPGEPLVFTVSDRFVDLKEARRHGISAMRSLPFCANDPGRRVWFRADVASVSDRAGMRELSAETEKKVLQSFGQNDKARLSADIRDWVAGLRRDGCTLMELFRLYEELRLLVLRRIRGGCAKGAEPSDIPHVKSFDLHLYNTFEAAEAVIAGELVALMGAGQPGGAGKNRWLVERAKAYIAERYAADLKASEVAAWLKITPSYFSLLFKQHEGRGFTDYLNELRIERAKTYLSETHDRVFEIADKVGYKDYKYFVAVFKSVTGVTPTDYRNREQNGRAG
ncbi:response regulator transcription factor [Paenibacillus flagellatus]|uniref:response regulator transcription factor n=1 Tax=Paenibacillus flagellatus TaxID=2211139 RepID=UPI001FE650BD|nr:response regulator [Paenibacillus flagellatus]